ncbi:MAG: tyrosine-protein phosphatase [Clostridia bacterium]|nr:tyrosine-protein phosphatase [Clostridia bacterium]
MKRMFCSGKIISLFLCIVMICTMITPMTLTAETYADLSQDVTNSVDTGISSATAQSTGTQTSAGLSLEFVSGSGLYLLSALSIDGIHECLSCTDSTACGYTTYNGRNCYRISANSSKQGGFTITLNTPVPASAVTGMSMTFMTDISPDTASATASARILAQTASSNSAMENDYSSISLAGATSEWKTIDLLMSDMTAIQDSDGYIRAFKFYIRDRNSATYYINSISFLSDMDGYAQVTLSDNDIRYKSGAVTAVAEEITSRLTAANISASVTVTATAYTANTSAADGSITYNVSFTTTTAGTQTYTGLTTVVPKITNSWLDNNSGNYGSAHNNLNQYETAFDKAGIISLSSNTASCAEGISTFEYAVIPSSADYKDSSVKWYAPTYLKTVTTGIRSLYINAFMDYGATLSSGTSYNFVIRAVSNNNNYILHLNVPFTYESFNTSAESALSAAMSKIQNLSLTIDGTSSATDAAETVTNALKNTVSNSNIIVSVTPVSIGQSSYIFDYSLGYSAEINSARLGTYTMGSFNRKDFYAHEGEAFTLKNQVVYYDANTKNNSIQLRYPLDGTSDILLINDRVKAYLDEDYYINYTDHNDVIVTKYSNGKTESDCRPLPINFAWTGSSGSYTLKISESSDMSSPITYTTDKTSIDVYNLFPATEYYWQVTDASSNSSAVYKFTTADNQPHQLYLENINNVRDAGGLTTIDGYRIKTGLLYRGGALEGATSYDIDMLVNKLGVKTDLDLRGSSTVSPLGADINMVPISVRWYQGIFESADTMTAIGNAVSVFAYESNYPVLFHCSLGRDRTGTVQALLMALCNVSAEEIHREYMLSWFSSMGNLDNAGTYAMNANVCELLKYMQSYKSPSLSLQENTEAFLLDCGVTATEIASIKSILVDYPTDGTELKFDNQAMINWVNKSGISTGSAVTFASDEIGDHYAKLTTPETADDDPKAYLDYSLLSGTVSADEYKYVTVVAKTTAANTHSTIFFCAGDTVNATSECYKTWTLINDGLWHEYVIDLSDLTLFTGNINKLRFDFFDGTTDANSVLYLRSIKFSKTLPSTPSVSVEKNIFDYGENIRVHYSGLFDEYRRQENVKPFLALYAENTSPGNGKALQYIALNDYSGYVSFPDDILYGTSVGALPEGKYYVWIAYDATNNSGTYTLNNVHYATYEPLEIIISESTSIISSGTSAATGTKIVTAHMGTTVNSLSTDAMTLFDSSAATVTNTAGTAAADSDIITTGMNIATDTDNYKVVVKGDVVPDGNINIADAAAAYAHILNNTELSGEYYDAALVKNTTNVNILDVMAILNMI